jgi:hypothetical protein
MQHLPDMWSCQDRQNAARWSPGQAGLAPIPRVLYVLSSAPSGFVIADLLLCRNYMDPTMVSLNMPGHIGCNTSPPSPPVILHPMSLYVAPLVPPDLHLRQA